MFWITRRKALTVSAAGLALTGRVAAADGDEPLLNPCALQGDLDAIWSTLLEVSPDPFQSSDRQGVTDLFHHARSRITSPITAREAWLAISPVLGALNDGHVAVGFPGALNEAPHRFPLSFAVDQPTGHLLVDYDRTGTVAAGSHVIAIEGVSAGDYLRTTMRAFGGQTPVLTRSRVSGAGAWTSIALFGVKPTYHVRWRDQAGVERNSAISTFSIKPGQHSGEPYEFRWVAPGVGLIDYRRCEDLSRFHAFLDETFKQLQSNGARALVIDIRHNSGGNSTLNNLLWCYAQARPFKQFGGKIVRSNAMLKAAYGEEKYVRYYGHEAWQARDGVVISSAETATSGLVVPGPLAVRFAGPVYLLISPRTFSSGMACALAAKDYGLATIVGQETGEPAVGTGELFKFVTPNTGFPVYLTTALFLAPKPHPTGQGVVPDVIVPANMVAAQVVGQDPVLEKALALIGG